MAGNGDQFAPLLQVLHPKICQGGGDEEGAYPSQRSIYDGEGAEETLILARDVVGCSSDGEEVLGVYQEGPGRSP